MCLTHSVGLHAANKKPDVKMVQTLLNMQLMALIPYRWLIIDGHCGPQTYDMIGEFQSRMMAMPHPTRVVVPASPTLRKLRSAVMPILTEDKLHAIMSTASDARVQKYLTPLINGMAAYSINTGLRMAHFLAQLGHESGDLIYSEEIASGAAYEGRKDLGNTQPGDGERFKGRGLIQITGRSNYTAYGKYKGKDFTTGNNNELLSTDADLAVDASCWFWMEHKLNDLADKDNLHAITVAINGGTNGLADRTAHFKRAKCLLVP